jgi:hypothetical protein
MARDLQLKTTLFWVMAHITHVQEGGTTSPSTLSISDTQTTRTFTHRDGVDTMVANIMGIIGTRTGTSVDGKGWPVFCCHAMMPSVVRGLMKCVDVGEHCRVPG